MRPLVITDSNGQIWHRGRVKPGAYERLKRMRDRVQGRQWVQLSRLCEAQNWRCAYCHERFADIGTNYYLEPSFDHVVPRTLGGKRNWPNGVAACHGCNGVKGDQDAYKFYSAVQAGIQLPFRGKPAKRERQHPRGLRTVKASPAPEVYSAKRFQAEWWAKHGKEV